jgi:prepilin-type N-terminal cleavage/methylation domain-containing protein
MPLNRIVALDPRDAPGDGWRFLRRSRRGNQRGYSLIEVMVATFLLSLAVLAFSALAPVSAKAAKMNGNYAQAVSIAQHKVDQLRAVGYGRLNYADLLAAEVIDASPNAQPFKFDTTEGLANYYPIFTSSITFSDVATDLKQATVTVSWTGQGDKPTQGNATLVVLIARE